MFANGFTAESRRAMESGFAESGGEGARQRAAWRAFCCRAPDTVSSSASCLSQASALRLRDRRGRDDKMGKLLIGELQHAAL